jgi:EAL and modified HD-GYP domain-containing signal transduction protein
MVRGRWCQSLAKEAELAPDVGFTIGLLSGVADLLGISTAELAERLPLTDEVAHALIDGEGEFGAVLAAVRAYEKGQDAADPTQLGGLAQSYLEAIGWSVATAEALRPSAGAEAS